MKHIQIKDRLIEYPFGDKLKANVKNMKSIIKDFIKIANDDLIYNNNIVLICRGSSGAMVSTLFFDALNKNKLLKNKFIKIIHIKKTGEISHGGDDVYLVSGKTLYVWVDDFIKDGDTILDCHKRFKKYEKFKFDYAVCSSVGCKLDKIENTTKNLIAFNCL